jgi:arylsulfatase A-like enzyme
MRILFLDLDTLRPDHLGCYGYHRDTSPNIDRLAAEGARFDGYYCSDAPCLPSRAALVSGRFGIHTGIIGHGGTAADMRLQGPGRGFQDRLKSESLWALLRSAGLHTVSISPFAERHGAWWFNAGFLEMYNTGGSGMESAEEVTPTALDWIERNGRRDNWALHVNYWDPHTPYRAPEEFGNPFADDALPAWLTEEVFAQHRNAVGPHTAREIWMYDSRTSPKYPRYPGELVDISNLRRMVDGYDCGIRYMDEHIGQLLSALEEQGVGDDLAIIITSDHGENMGELGIYGEHATADAITTSTLRQRWRNCSAGLAHRAGTARATLRRSSVASRVGGNGSSSVSAHTSASAACEPARGCMCAPTTMDTTSSRRRCSSTWAKTPTSSATSPRRGPRYAIRQPIIWPSGTPR